MKLLAKKAVALLAVLALVAGALPAAAFAYFARPSVPQGAVPASGVQVLQIGRAAVAYFDGLKATKRWYSFTAPVDGSYRFYSAGAADAYGALYVKDAAGYELKAASDDEGVDANFQLTAFMQAGERCYLCASMADSDDAGTVAVQVARQDGLVSLGFENLEPNDYTDEFEEGEAVSFDALNLKLGLSVCNLAADELQFVTVPDTAFAFAGWYRYEQDDEDESAVERVALDGDAQHGPSAGGSYAVELVTTGSDGFKAGLRRFLPFEIDGDVYLDPAKISNLSHALTGASTDMFGSSVGIEPGKDAVTFAALGLELGTWVTDEDSLLGSFEAIPSDAFTFAGWYRYNDEGERVLLSGDVGYAFKASGEYMLKVTAVAHSGYRGSKYLNVTVFSLKDLSALYGYAQGGMGGSGVFACTGSPVSYDAVDPLVYAPVGEAGYTIVDAAAYRFAGWYTNEEKRIYGDAAHGPAANGHYMLRIEPTAGSGYTGYQYIYFDVFDGHDLSNALVQGAGGSYDAATAVELEAGTSLGYYGMDLSLYMPDYARAEESYGMPDYAEVPESAYRFAAWYALDEGEPRLLSGNAAYRVEREGFYELELCAVAGNAAGYTGSVRISVYVSIEDDGSAIAIRNMAWSRKATGKALRPAPLVVDSGGCELLAGLDYTLKYANNVKPGVATVSVVGRGRYEHGYDEARFLIVKPSSATFNEPSLNAKKLKAAIAGNPKMKRLVLGPKVRKVAAGTFKGTKIKTVTVKSKHLRKRGVKGAFKKSKVRTVRVKVGTKKQNRRYAKRYARVFAQKVAGKKVTVK